MGNVGQHYFLWRYYGNPWAVPDPQLPITFASTRDGGDSTVYQMDATGGQQEGIDGSDTALVPSSQLGWWFTDLPPAYRVVYGNTTAYTGKRQLAVLVPQAPFRNRALISDANDYEPAIAPDGTQLAFVSDRDGNPELYLLALNPERAIESRTAIRLTDTHDCVNAHPSWLPDGSGLVYASTCQGGSFALYRASLSYTLDANAQIAVAQLISPGADQATRLTSSIADDHWPRVSPDGSQIAFVSNRDGNDEIYLMSIDGSGQTRLTNSAARDEAPAWSQDGRQLVFTSDRDGDDELFRVNRDGSGLVQLTSNAVDDNAAVWAP
jgi:Tol biopolymer transport system component